MSNKIKHSKIKNTGILFELLTRQITADILSNKEGNAVNILKNYFSPKTQLGKEYELYKVLTTQRYSNENKANHLIEAVLKTYTKINKKQLKSEKYNLVNEIKNNYDVNEFFMARISNYKLYASVYKLFETINTESPIDETESRYTIVENITKKEARLFENSLLAKATNSRPTYIMDGVKNNITLFGRTPTLINVDYITSPKQAKWTYVVVDNKALHNSTAEDKQDFQLHASEETDLVLKILTLAGFTLKDPNLYQAAASEDMKSVQQEKQ
jgi:hypothetical protein